MAKPCVIHIGPGGAGHYVKMIHDGIEYGDMQLICEAYNIFKHAGFTTDEMAAIFNDWNEGDLQSYLIQITGKASCRRTPKPASPSSNSSLDKAGQKGTGQWTVHQRRRKRRRHQHHQRRRRGPHPLRQKKQRVAASTHPRTDPTVDDHRPTKAHSSRRSTTPSTRPRSSATRRASTSSRRMGEKKNWGLDLGRIARHLARRLHHPRAAS